MEWSEGDLEYYERVMRHKRDREEEIRRQLGWSDLRIGLYTVDAFLPPSHHSPGTTVAGNRPSLRRSSTQLAQKRQRNKREVK
jgi:hypothetical protein